MNDSFSISGKRCLITGATAGIGLGVAKHFVEAGAQVVISGRRASGKDIAAEIGAQFVAMDVSDGESITEATGQAAKQLGGVIDVLILNAGIVPVTGLITGMDLAEFRRGYEVNVFGLTQGLRDALPFMGKGSSVILTSSPASLVNPPGMSSYNSSKAAVNSLTETFAAELAPKGIRVNTVLPGLVNSEATAADSVDESFILQQTLTGVAREPWEMGGTYQFLASQASEPVTAAIISADDGIGASVTLDVVTAVAGSA